MPSGTDSRLDAFQAINCLATIIGSLRDKVRQLPRRKQHTIRCIHHGFC